jgi:hypothetical protein
MVHDLKLCKSSLKFKENGQMTKELEFQESICFYVLKLNIDPFHFQREYLIHFLTTLNHFNDFGCAR